ncbi:MAG: hypothetical protein ACTHLC_04590, partial [Rhizobiaceae bacterium]
MAEPRRRSRFRNGIIIAAGVLVALAPPDSARAGAEAARKADNGIDRICALIATQADVHALPRDFLARLIWKESRFDANAVSP